MKRIFFLSALPLLLFGLEKVNLIKNSSFERDDYIWKSYTGSRANADSAIVNDYDTLMAHSGSYSGSCDTRKYPGVAQSDSAVIIQEFSVSKSVSDIDNFVIYYADFPKNGSPATCATAFAGLYINADSTSYTLAGYYLTYPGSGAISVPPWVFLEVIDFPADSSWDSLSKNIHNDLIGKGISSMATLDSFFITGFGGFYSSWRGQKVYWDDIRLTGYADYDVGVKGILSKDSIGNAYIPTARVKNFGRKPADSFLVIVTIEGGSGVVYADTLSWSLTADTEDTVSFKEFKPSDALDYTLTFSTVMTPDESDEDDVMSKTLYGTGITETPSPYFLQLEVVALSSIRYSLPQGEQGTISLYDPAGRKVESLRVKGTGEVRLKPDLASGVYFIRLETGKVSIARKFVILH